MEPLIKITNIPMSIELKVNNARLEYNTGNTDLEISREKGGLKIKSRPIKLNIDSYESFNSIVPTTKRSIEQAAQRGKNAAYEAIATYAKEGMLFLNAKIGEDVIGRIAGSQPQGSSDFGLAFTPSVPPKISWKDPEFTIQYEMDKLNFEWKASTGYFEFIPGNIEINIKQRPDVIIEYIGDPIYIPLSANPNYKPTDIRA